MLHACTPPRLCVFSAVLLFAMLRAAALLRRGVLIDAVTQAVRICLACARRREEVLQLRHVPNRRQRNGSMQHVPCNLRNALLFCLF